MCCLMQVKLANNVIVCGRVINIAACVVVTSVCVCVVICDVFTLCCAKLLSLFCNMVSLEWPAFLFFVWYLFRLLCVFLFVCLLSIFCLSFVYFRTFVFVLSSFVSLPAVLTEFLLQRVVNCQADCLMSVFTAATLLIMTVKYRHHVNRFMFCRYCVFYYNLLKPFINLLPFISTVFSLYLTTFHQS